MERIPQEVWIEFGGDPSDDKEIYKRYCAKVAFFTKFPDSEVLHTIEKWAYDKVVSQLAATRDLLNKAIEVNDFYEADRVRWKERVSQLKEQAAQLKADLSHTDAAAGLTLGELNRIKDRLKEMREHLCDGGGNKPCSQMLYQDWIDELLSPGGRQ